LYCNLLHVLQMAIGGRTGAVLATRAMFETTSGSAGEDPKDPCSPCYSSAAAAGAAAAGTAGGASRSTGVRDIWEVTQQEQQHQHQHQQQQYQQSPSYERTAHSSDSAAAHSRSTASGSALQALEAKEDEVQLLLEKVRKATRFSCKLSCRRFLQLSCKVACRHHFHKVICRNMDLMNAAQSR
jgi:hypothetical protein